MKQWLRLVGSNPQMTGFNKHLNENRLWHWASEITVTAVIIVVLVDKEIKQSSNLIFKHLELNFMVRQGDAAKMPDGYSCSKATRWYSACGEIRCRERARTLTPCAPQHTLTSVCSRRRSSEHLDGDGQPHSTAASSLHAEVGLSACTPPAPLLPHQHCDDSHWFPVSQCPGGAQLQHPWQHSTTHSAQLHAAKGAAGTLLLCCWSRQYPRVTVIPCRSRIAQKERALI